jgi:hypothetical protein
METLRVLLTQFTDESITLSLSLMALTGVSIILYWLHHRRKMHQLVHQIPASVVKNYLDSIIQNSNALKSSLFRGGGLDLSNGIPSVLPVADLPQGNASVSNEELNQRKAEISQLTMRLMEKERMVQDLEKQLQKGGSSSGSNEEIAIYKKEIARLQKELEALRASKGNAAGGDDAAIKKELVDVTKERDELKERLMEYEIIEEDLANLKRLQQENEQLKKALAAGGGKAAAPAAAAAASAAIAEVEEPAEAEAPAVEAAEEEAPAMQAAEEEEEAPAAPVAEAEEAAPKAGGEQKSAEELLSEFEKMLG